MDQNNSGFHDNGGRRNVCIFCGRGQGGGRTLIQSSDGNCICSDCILRCYRVLSVLTASPIPGAEA